MATVKAAVKQSLLGTEQEADLSLQTKATFDKYSTRDEANGEVYMTEDDFVSAIAPETENYVSLIFLQNVYPEEFPASYKPIQKR